MEKYSSGATDSRKIYLYYGNIVDLDVDALVNSASPTLMGGLGVDGAIHKAAGSELLEECKTLGGCNFGSAKITKGYRIKAKYIIHAVGPIYTESLDQSAVLKSSYLSSLQLARENDIHSIAFPAISCGAFNYPLNEALNIAVDAIFEFKAKNRDYHLITVFVAYDEKTYDEIQKIYDVSEIKWQRLLEATGYGSILESLTLYRDKTVLGIENKSIRKMISGETFIEKFKGILSPDRYRREKLVKTGHIVWARVLECKVKNFDEKSLFIARIIFSPQPEFKDNPNFYEKVLSNVLAFLETSGHGKLKLKERRLLCSLRDDGEEPKYYPLPETLTDGRIVYLSTLILNPEKSFDPFTPPKYVPIFMNQSLSKEVIVVPPGLYSEEYFRHLKLNSSN